MKNDNSEKIQTIVNTLPGKVLLLGSGNQILASKEAPDLSEAKTWAQVKLFLGSRKACTLFWDTEENIGQQHTQRMLEMLFKEWVPIHSTDSLVQILTEPYCQKFEETAPEFLKGMHSLKLGVINIPSQYSEELRAGLAELLPQMNCVKIEDSFHVMFMPVPKANSLQWPEAVMGFINEDLMADATLVMGLPVVGIQYLYGMATALMRVAKGLFQLREYGIRVIETLPFENCLAVLNGKIEVEILDYLSSSIENITLDEDLDLTAKTFLKYNLSISDTAQALFLHRNTLVYRLAKIEKMTGLDLKRFDHAMAFYGLNRIRNRTSF